MDVQSVTITSTGSKRDEPFASMLTFKTVALPAVYEQVNKELIAL